MVTWLLLAAESLRRGYKGLGFNPFYAEFQMRGYVVFVTVKFALFFDFFNVFFRGTVKFFSFFLLSFATLSALTAGRL